MRPRHAYRRQQKNQQLAAVLSLCKEQSAFILAGRSEQSCEEEEELEQRLAAIKPCLKAQMDAAGKGRAVHTARNLVGRDEYVMRGAAVHNFQIPFAQLTPGLARKMQRGQTKLLKQHSPSSGEEQGTSKGDEASSQCRDYGLAAEGGEESHGGHCNLCGAWLHRLAKGIYDGAQVEKHATPWLENPIFEPHQTTSEQEHPCAESSGYMGSESEVAAQHYDFGRVPGEEPAKTLNPGDLRSHATGYGEGHLLELVTEDGGGEAVLHREKQGSSANP